VCVCVCVCERERERERERTWICWLKCVVEVLYILFWTLTYKYNLYGYIYCLSYLNVEYVWMFIYLFFYTRLYTSFFKIEFELEQHHLSEYVCALWASSFFLNIIK
jgi:hypothetical protein